MASSSGTDNILSAILGALEGFQSAYEPYQRMRFQQQSHLQQLQNELPIRVSMAGQEASAKAQAEFPYQQKLRQMTLDADKLRADEANQILGSDILLYNPDMADQIDPNKKYSKTAAMALRINNVRETSQQDKLENQAISRLSGIRGDVSMAKIEAQRDASIQAYNTINQIKQENRLPSQIEYYDIIGQLWKARTGQSPTNEAIRDLDARTFKGDIGKVSQYFIGQPAGRTTAEVLDNIQYFSKVSGIQADKLHEGYMSTHLIKPLGLNEDRWQNIINSQRGLSFQEATGATVGASSPIYQPGSQPSRFRSADEILNHYLGGK